MGRRLLEGHPPQSSGFPGEPGVFRVRVHAARGRDSCGVGARVKAAANTDVSGTPIATFLSEDHWGGGACVGPLGRRGLRRKASGAGPEEDR